MWEVFDHIEESSKKTEEERRFSGFFNDIDLNSSRLKQEVISRNKKFWTSWPRSVK